MGEGTPAPHIFLCCLISVCFVSFRQKEKQTSNAAEEAGGLGDLLIGGSKVSSGGDKDKKVVNEVACSTSISREISVTKFDMKSLAMPVKPNEETLKQKLPTVNELQY